MSKLPFEPNWGKTLFKRMRMAASLYNIRRNRKGTIYIIGNSASEYIVDENGNRIIEG